MKNYIDDKGNYINVENLSLKQIFDEGFEDGYSEGIKDASPKKAEWKKISPASIYECSNCHHNVMTGDIGNYHYCHGCGSYMD